MPDRRTFLASAAAAALVSPSSLRAAPAQPALAYARYGDFFIVDGWVLTRRDLESLGVHAG